MIALKPNPPVWRKLLKRAGNKRVQESRFRKKASRIRLHEEIEGF